MTPAANMVPASCICIAVRAKTHNEQIQQSLQLTEGSSTAGLQVQKRQGRRPVPRPFDEVPERLATEDAPVHMNEVIQSKQSQTT